MQCSTDEEHDQSKLARRGNSFFKFPEKMFLAPEHWCSEALP
jgi:hypothetical protein